MAAIAPNLTVMVGELVGARLIAHAGSLMNLAKHPASTVQILGAEKALFRALKTKKETPKYGLIYHASMVGQSTAKNKGKISRVLAAKTALSVRVDALGDQSGATIAIQDRAKVEQRLRQLEGGAAVRLSGTGKSLARNEKYSTPAASAYNASSDVVMDAPADKKKKRKLEATEPEADGNGASEEKADKKSKKDKKEKKQKEEAPAEEEPVEEPAPKKSKKDKKAAEEEKPVEEEKPKEKKSKKEKK